MNRFHKIVNKVYESLLPSEETVNRITERHLNLYNIKTK